MRHFIPIIGRMTRGSLLTLAVIGTASLGHAKDSNSHSYPVWHAIVQVVEATKHETNQIAPAINIAQQKLVKSVHTTSQNFERNRTRGRDYLRKCQRDFRRARAALRAYRNGNIDSTIAAWKRSVKSARDASAPLKKALGVQLRDLTNLQSRFALLERTLASTIDLCATAEQGSGGRKTVAQAKSKATAPAKPKATATAKPKATAPKVKKVARTSPKVEIDPACKNIDPGMSLWSTDFNNVVLPASYSGSVKTDYGSGTSITGRFRGRFLSGAWTEKSSDGSCNSSRKGTKNWGSFSFKFNSNFTKFVGTWGYCNEKKDETWNGQLICTRP